jgi:hypothetical protein
MEVREVSAGVTDDLFVGLQVEGLRGAARIVVDEVGCLSLDFTLPSWLSD